MKSFNVLASCGLLLLLAWFFSVSHGQVSADSAADQASPRPAGANSISPSRSSRPSIRQLTQHFNDPAGDFSPWNFLPAENIKQLSTSEHPGLLTLCEAGRGADIKGLLTSPIKIDDYPTPWEFQTSLVQSFSVLAGVGAKTQANTAIGLNIAVTSSDPATWPVDRTMRPADTKEFQLLVVHLGCTGEAGVGLPQFSTEPHPETYLVWGRGDLGETVMGDWRIPYVWIGDGAKYAGPASPQLFFRCVVHDPTHLSMGIKFEASHGWNMRHIDCSALGKITGIWEIGPIISADRWIPDVLCRNLPQLKGPHPLFLGNADAKNYRQADQMIPVRAATRAAESAIRVLCRLLRFFRRRAAAAGRILGRFQHRRLPRPVAGSGAVHVDGHALASGAPDAETAWPGSGHRLLSGWRPWAQIVELPSSLGDRNQFHRPRRRDPLEPVHELRATRSPRQADRRLAAWRREPA